MAQAVKDSVDEEIRSLMLECITEGGLSEEEITRLLPLGLNAINPNSSEWIFLNNLLTKEDSNGLTLRRETVYLMLTACESEVPISNFVTHIFLEYKQLRRSSPAAFGWYFYYLCEALHYGIESIFCYVLDCIDKFQNPPVSVLLDNAVDDLVMLLNDEQQYKSIDEWIKDYHAEIEWQLSEVKRLVKGQDYAKSVIESLKLFWLLDQEFQQNQTAMMDFEQKYDLVRQRGILSEGLKDYVERYVSLPIRTYLEKVLRQVMNEHTFVAIKKMGNSYLDLRKFILENGCAILVEMRYPNETNPRIESLHNFLVDLGYLKIDNTTTPIAKKFLSEYGKE